MVEIWGNKPADERTIAAFARLNYIHGHYIKKGLISNDDMLYTLAQFMCEPIKYVNFFLVCSRTPFIKALHSSILLCHAHI